MVSEFKGVHYEERLSRLNLTSLETRRLRGDMIQVFGMLKGFDDIDRDSFFKVSSTGLRGHSLKLFKNNFQTNTGRFSFSNRIVSDWNSLPEHVISSNTIISFKNRLDRHYQKYRGFK